MGVKAGLDPHLMIDVINAGSGRSTASEAKFPRSILPRTFDFGFTAGLMLKDLRLCMEEAEALGVPAEILRVVRNWFELAVSENGPEKDMTTVIQCIERRAGVEVAGAQAKI
jgi:3-hydroxyisobutyrate dehydrogenase-like beta-hydroxyacid dehydrogenase